MLNFGRYLDRLGIKQKHEPILLGSVQPTAIVADLRDLVSLALRPCGIVGGAVTPVLGIDGPLIAGVCPVAMRVQVTQDNSFAGQWRWKIGAPVPMNLSTALTPQPMGDFGGETFESTWVIGTALIADLPGAGFPTTRVTNASSIVLPEIYVPAGQTFTLVSAVTGNGTAGFMIRFFELPTENPA